MNAQPQGTAALPAGLVARPVDPRRNLPIPVVNEFGDGTWDFTVTNAAASIELAGQRRCGLCGLSMDWWVAFLGGPASAATGVYSDPPMHVECAEAALRLCPHITRPNMRRAKTPSGAVTPAGMGLDRPDEWVMWVTRSFRMHLGRSGDQAYPVFLPAPAKQLRHWAYADDGTLVERGAA